MDIKFVAEFTGGYDASVKGVQRLVTVSADADSVRIVIQGEHPASNNLGFVTMSDETYPIAMWATLFRDVVITAPGFKLVRGEQF